MTTLDTVHDPTSSGSPVTFGVACARSSLVNFQVEAAPEMMAASGACPSYRSIRTASTASERPVQRAS